MAPIMTIYYQYYASPVGQLLLLAKAEGLIAIEFAEEQATTDISTFMPASQTSGQILEIFCKTTEILDRYFQCETIDFSQLDFLAPQGSPFQQAVGRNPISILIPCHRVLGKNQSLTGFGGGLPSKRYLLELEGISYRNQGIEYVNPKTKKWNR